MSDRVCFTLNGRAERLSEIDPHTTLLSYLRSRGLTGTKEGCAEGECGACAVVVVVRGPDGRARYEAVNSCLLLLPALHGAELYTVEGVAGPDAERGLHPVQCALMREGGSQCGYCTPGFVMSLFAHFYRSPRDPVERAVSGNLCRCTGYRPIRDAARDLPQAAEDDAFLVRLRGAAPVPARLSYRACGVDFELPTELGAALALRAADPAAQVIAGGTDLVVEINQSRSRRTRWISLQAVQELQRVEATSECWVLGAGLTLAELEERLHSRIPLLTELWPLFASLPIRTRATLGGNLVTASPVGDAAPVLLALDAEVELASARGTRLLPLEQFFTGYRATALQPDELLVSVRVPQAQPSLARFFKVAKRVVDDIACVSAAFALTIEAGEIRKARLAFGGIAATPVRAHAAEAALLGRRWDAEALAAAQSAVRGAFAPISDARGSAGYRAAMIERLLEKFWHEGAP